MSHDEVCDSADGIEHNNSVVLHAVPWKLYRKLRAIHESRNISMVYDRGELEISATLLARERIAGMLGSLISVWSLERNLPICSCRKMTLYHAGLEHGFEPDNCYYIQHEPQMWDKNKINFKKDPPPDLAIEVEVTHKLLDKESIYAAFCVPELWVWRNGSLTAFELSQNNEYVARESSVALPGFPIAEAQEVVRKLGQVHETELVCSFRDRVREQASAPKPASD